MAAESWRLRRRESPQGVKQLIDLGLDPLLAKVLYARRIETQEQVQAFLYAQGGLGEALLLPDMAIAVERLHRALQGGEQIVVYGDFDVDGVCATALLVTAFRRLGGHVLPYIPDRFDEGYGLNGSALERLREQGAQVVVTVDCGVRALEEVKRATALNLDLIITDHHMPGEQLPPAMAIIDPKREGCPYPFRDLAGVGVAYRLAEVLLEGQTPGVEDLLDLVAIGTVADVAPLVGENRLLVQRGLQQLRQPSRAGVRALMKVAGVSPDRVGSQDIGFRLGPRLNAAGRLRNARLSYQLLMTADEQEAQQLAAELDAVNRERQQMLEEQTVLGRRSLWQSGARGVLFVEGPSFHEGIVGLVAHRLSELFHRPCLVIHREEGMSRGSARSIDGFHITQALDHCADLLLRHGGHAHAAGFTVRSEDLPALRERLETYSTEHLSPEVLEKRRQVDAIIRLDQLTGAAADALALMEPCGEDNPEPVLATEGLQVLGVTTVGQDGQHLRLELSDGQRNCTAIAFGRGHRAGQVRPGNIVDIMYKLRRNDWQGPPSLDLVVEEWRPKLDWLEVNARWVCPALEKLRQGEALAGEALVLDGLAGAPGEGLLALSYGEFLEGREQWSAAFLAYTLATERPLPAGQRAQAQRGAERVRALLKGQPPPPAPVG